MYKEFFGFDKTPFSLNPDPGFLFLGKTQKSVVSHLEDGLLNKLGIMVVTGQIGTGKSTHIHYLLGRLDQNYSIALITNTHFETLAEMLANILLAFSVKLEKENTVVSLEQLFKEFLTSEYHKNNKVLLIIDEAQNLSEELLENLRLLSNFSIDNMQVFQLILVGQESLLKKIQSFKFEQLNQRISIFETLLPLDRKETHQYILHRLEMAGGLKCRQIIELEACNVIYKYSGGIPKLINLISELALFTAYEADLKKVNSGLIEDVVNERKGGVLKFKYVVSFFNHEEDLYLEQLHADVSSETINDEAITDKNNIDQTVNVENKVDLLTLVPVIPASKEESGQSIEMAEDSFSEPSLLEQMISTGISKEDTNEEDKKESGLDNTLLSRDRTFNIGRKKLALSAVCILFGLMIFVYFADNYSYKEKQSLQVHLNDKTNLNKSIDSSQKALESAQVESVAKSVNEDKVELAEATIPSTQLQEKPKKQKDISLSVKLKQENEMHTESPDFIKTETVQLTEEIANLEKQTPELPKITNAEVNSVKDELTVQKNADSQVDIPVSIKKEQFFEEQKTKSNIVETASIDLPNKAVSIADVNPELVQTTTLDKTIQKNQALTKPSKSDEEINALLAVAEAYVSELKFTTPEEKSAWNTYKKILKIEPKQQQALDGVKKIKDIYIFWAEREVDESNFERAEHFFSKALIVAPTDKVLFASLDEVKNIRKTMSAAIKE